RGTMVQIAGRRIVSLVGACSLAVSLAAQNKEPAVKPAALAKLAEPWPDAEVLRERRIEAEKRPLFSDAGLIPLTLTADFKAINKDRRPEGKKDYAGVLSVGGANGAADALQVNLRTRGHFRLRSTSCSFVPLRVDFGTERGRG